MVTDPENLESEALLPEEPKTEVARFGLGPGVVLFLAGAVFGLLGAFLQAVTVNIGDIALPVGLILILATLFASLRMVVHIYGLRRAGVIVLVGWTLATVVLSLPGPGGDVARARPAREGTVPNRPFSPRGRDFGGHSPHSQEPGPQIRFLWTWHRGHPGV